MGIVNMSSFPHGEHTKNTDQR